MLVMSGKISTLNIGASTMIFTSRRTCFSCLTYSKTLETPELYPAWFFHLTWLTWDTQRPAAHKTTFVSCVFSLSFIYVNSILPLILSYFVSIFFNPCFFLWTFINTAYPSNFHRKKQLFICIILLFIRYLTMLYRLKRCVLPAQMGCCVICQHSVWKHWVKLQELQFCSWIFSVTTQERKEAGSVWLRAAQTGQRILFLSPASIRALRPTQPLV